MITTDLEPRTDAIAAIGRLALCELRDSRTRSAADPAERETDAAKDEAAVNTAPLTLEEQCYLIRGRYRLFCALARGGTEQ